MLAIDLEEGKRLLLSDIQKLVAADAELQNISIEREEELINNLKQHRELKKSGARTSNVSAAKDARATMLRLNEEVSPTFSFRLCC